MPLYEFRCPEGQSFEEHHPMAQVPGKVPCPHCGEPAARRISAPRLSLAGSSVYGLIEASERSAHEPEVVRSTAPGGGARGPGYTTNPLHRKLPRP